MSRRLRFVPRRRAGHGPVLHWSPRKHRRRPAGVRRAGRCRRARDDARRRAARLRHLPPRLGREVPGPPPADPVQPQGPRHGDVLASPGYVVVLQDTRGRFDSGGEFYPFRHEANDGYDTVEWAAALRTPRPRGHVRRSYVGRDPDAGGLGRAAAPGRDLPLRDGRGVLRGLDLPGWRDDAVVRRIVDVGPRCPTPWRRKDLGAESREAMGRAAAPSTTTGSWTCRPPARWPPTSGIGCSTKRTTSTWRAVKCGPLREDEREGRSTWRLARHLQRRVDRNFIEMQQPGAGRRGAQGPAPDVALGACADVARGQDRRRHVSARRP